MNGDFGENVHDLQKYVQRENLRVYSSRSGNPLTEFLSQLTDTTSIRKLSICQPSIRKLSVRQLQIRKLRQFVNINVKTYQL